MNINRMDKLIERANHIYKCKNLGSEVEFENIEKKLNVILPEEFKYICRHYTYEHLGEFYSIFGEENYSIIGETLTYRQTLNLPHKFLRLAEDEVSLTFMETNKNSENPSLIYWISIEDCETFCKSKSLESDYDLFPSFTDFFENLIERKEELAREEKEYEESQKR